MQFSLSVSILIAFVAVEAKSASLDNGVQLDEGTRQFILEQSRDTREAFKFEMSFLFKNLYESLDEKFMTKTEQLLQIMSESVTQKFSTIDSKIDRLFGNLPVSQQRSLTNTEKAKSSALPPLPQTYTDKVVPPGDVESTYYTTEPNNETREFFKSEMAFVFENILNPSIHKIAQIGLEVENSVQNLSDSFNQEFNNRVLEIESAFAGQSEVFSQELRMTNSKLDRLINHLTKNQTSSLEQKLTTLLGFFEEVERMRDTAGEVCTQQPKVEESTKSDSNEVPAENLSMWKRAQPQYTETPTDPSCLSLEFKSKSEINSTDNLVEAGIGSKREKLYVCATFVGDQLFIGKSIFPSSSKSECWVPYNNTEASSLGHVFTNYRLLTNPGNAKLSWKLTSKGKEIPTGSVLEVRWLGELGNEAYHVGRCKLGQQKLPGPINSITGEMMVTFGHQVFQCSNYDILTCSSGEEKTATEETTRTESSSLEMFDTSKEL